MNKQEAIEKIKNIETLNIKDRMDDKGVDMVIKNQVIDLISKIDEPQKPVVPKFVANRIEFCKKYPRFWDLQMVLSRLDDDEKVGDWAYDENDDLISEKAETFARAWLDGYHKEEDKELWKHIPGFQNEVSNLGRVRSLTHTAGNGKVYQGKVLKNILTKSGYLNVTLITGSDEEKAVKRVHRLVAEAFCPNPDGKDEINHRDGNKENNRADNLEWVTRSENEQHAYDNNLINVLKGSKKPMAKLDEQDVLNIRKEYAEGCIQNELAEKYGVARQTISSIVNRKAWKHV